MEPTDLGERDRQAVAGGMELLRWELSATVAATLTRRIRREGPDVLILIVVLVLAWVGAGLVIFTQVVDTSSSWTVFFTLATVGLVLGVMVPLYRHLRPDPVPERRSIGSGEIRFTSTGVLAGEQSWLWRAVDYRLRSISLDAGELALDFGQRGALTVPVPARLAADVDELARMLEARVRSLDREMVPADAPRPK